MHKTFCEEAEICPGKKRKKRCKGKKFQDSTPISQKRNRGISGGDGVNKE